MSNLQWLLIEELTLSLGPQWNGGVPDGGLVWRYEYLDDGSSAIRVIDLDRWLGSYSVQVLLHNDRIRHWRLLDENDAEVFAIPDWQSLKASIALTREYIERQQRIQRNANP